MSREIKFRAWSISGNKMRDWESLLPIGMNAFVDGKHLEFMQYTGLKDSTGREIYEGDILSYDEKVWGGINSFEVSWSESEASFTGNGVVSEWPEFCEVIGSIYENPELLTPPTT